MNIALTIGILVYVIIAYFFHIGILSEVAKDKSDDLAGINPTILKFWWVVASLLWPLLLLYAFIEAKFRKEDM